MSVPVPKFPVQLYGILASASLVDVQVKAEVWPVVIVEGLNEVEQVGNATTPVPERFTVVTVPATPPVFE